MFGGDGQAMTSIALAESRAWLAALSRNSAAAWTCAAAAHCRMPRKRLALRMKCQ